MTESLHCRLCLATAHHKHSYVNKLSIRVLKVTIMLPKRPTTAAKRQQANLAGAGNFLAWSPGDAGESKAADEESKDADGPLTVVGVGEGGSLPAALAARLQDMLAEAAEARTDMEKDHALFQRIIIHRVQEARNIAAIWRNGDVVDALRYLQMYAHESVAIDVLHALAACNQAMSVAAPCQSDAEAVDGGESAGAVTVTAVGGLPCWEYPAYGSIEWLEYVSPVLEGLLRSQFEDYLSVATRCAGNVLDALDALLRTARDECSAGDLEAPAVPDEPGGAGEAEGKDGDDESAALAAYDAAWRRHAVAAQAVRALHLLQPITRGLERASSRYEGRIGKLCSTRLARLTEWRDALRHLRIAAAAARGAEG